MTIGQFPAGRRLGLAGSGFMQRFMFLRLIAFTGAAGLLFAFVVLLTTTQKLFYLLAQGVLPLDRFLTGLATVMPMVFYVVGPVAAPVAIAYAYHDWGRHHEILSLRMAGLSSRALALPALAAGMAAMLFTAAMSLYLLPVSFRVFEDILYDAASNLNTGLLDQGYLQAIAPHLALSFQRRLDEDVLGDVTIVDDRKPDTITYILANRVHILIRRQPEPGFVLVAEDGSYVTRPKGEAKTGLSSRVAFARFDIPVSETDSDHPFLRSWRGFFEEHIGRLLAPPPEVRLNPAQYGQWVAEGHNRILAPLLAPSYVLLVVGVLLRASYRRRQWWSPRLLLLLLGLGAWHVLFVVAHSFMAWQPALIPLYYLLALVPGLIGYALLRSADEAPHLLRSPPFGIAARPDPV